jgi:hypothetical protein
MGSVRLGTLGGGHGFFALSPTPSALGSDDHPPHMASVIVTSAAFCLRIPSSTRACMASATLVALPLPWCKLPRRETLRFSSADQRKACNPRKNRCRSTSTLTEMLDIFASNAYGHLLRPKAGLFAHESSTWPPFQSRSTRARDAFIGCGYTLRRSHQMSGALTDNQDQLRCSWPSRHLCAACRPSSRHLKPVVAPKGCAHREPRDNPHQNTKLT